jgi:predicted nucleotidyltransferase
MKLSDAKKQLIIKYFRDKPVLRAYVFGSYASGSATAESDLDILVELDYRRKVGLEFIQMKLDLETLLKQEVDLVSAKGVSRYLEPIIHQSRQLIYAR